MKVLYCIALLIGWSSAEKEKGIQELFELVSSLRSEVVALRQLPATSTSSPIQPQKLPTQELGDLQKEVSSLRSEVVALRQLTQRYEVEQIQLKKKISLLRESSLLDELSTPQANRATTVQQQPFKNPAKQPAPQSTLPPVPRTTPQQERLDEDKLIERCRRNDLAYVEAQVKKFGKEAVLAAKKWGSHCLHNVLYYSTSVSFYGGSKCPWKEVENKIWQNIKHLPTRSERRHEVKRVAQEECAKKQAKLVEYLLDQGADANEKSANYGDSAIFTATYTSSIPVMEMLLNHGADIEIPNNFGETPIMRSTAIQQYSIPKYGQSNNTAALSLLIARGANINATDKDGYTALAQATQQGEIPAMKLLLNSGADTEIADNMGQTPIFHTGSSRVAKGKKGQKEKEEALSLLLGKGAKIDAEDKNGNTAYGVAMCNKEDEWGSVLLNHGANKTQDVPKPKGDQGEGEGEGRWC